MNAYCPSDLYEMKRKEEWDLKQCIICMFDETQIFTPTAPLHSQFVLNTEKIEFSKNCLPKSEA